MSSDSEIESASSDPEIDSEIELASSDPEIESDCEIDIMSSDPEIEFVLGIKYFSSIYLKIKVTASTSTPHKSVFFISFALVQIRT
jgi:hypothetical protein